jgi:hypothetical protein
VPVAATEVDGIPELVTHGVTGRLSPPGDAEGLAANIVWILDHRSEALKMAAAGRARVIREWSADRMVSRIDDAYRLLLEERDLGNGSRSTTGARPRGKTAVLRTPYAAVGPSPTTEAEILAGPRTPPAERRTETCEDLGR